MKLRKNLLFTLLAIVLFASSCIPTKRIRRQFSQQAIYQVDWSEWQVYLKDSTLSPCLENDNYLWRDSCLHNLQFLIYSDGKNVVLSPFYTKAYLDKNSNNPRVLEILKNIEEDKFFPAQYKIKDSVIYARDSGIGYEKAAYIQKSANDTIQLLVIDDVICELANKPIRLIKLNPQQLCQ